MGKRAKSGARCHSNVLSPLLRSLLRCKPLATPRHVQSVPPFPGKGGQRSTARAKACKKFAVGEERREHFAVASASCAHRAVVRHPSYQSHKHLAKVPGRLSRKFARNFPGSLQVPRKFASSGDMIRDNRSRSTNLETSVLIIRLPGLACARIGDHVGVGQLACAGESFSSRP